MGWWNRKDTSSAESAGNLPPSAGSRRQGPFDVSEVKEPNPVSAERLDFGAVQVPPLDGLEIRVELDEESNEPMAIMLEYGRGAVQVRAFAGPSAGGGWATVLDDLRAQIASGGGEVWESVGPFGTELASAVIGADERGNEVVQPVRFVGVDGPGWLLQGVFFGEGTETGRADPLEGIFRSLVVVRGDAPMPVGSMLPLTMPEQIPGQAEASDAASRSAVSDGDALAAYLGDKGRRFGRARLAEAVAGVAVEGAFNVEAGWAAVSCEEFGECDAMNLCFSLPIPFDSAVVGPFATSGMACECGRSSLNTVPVMAGFGDGLYPVSRWTDRLGRTVGLAAWFAGATTMGELRPQVEEATSVQELPGILDDWSLLRVGSLESDGALYFSDVGSFMNYVLECAAPIGQYSVMAWVAPEATTLSDAGVSGPRPMMVAAVTGDLADAMSPVIAGSNQQALAGELRRINGGPMQVVLSNLEPLEREAADLTARLRAEQAVPTGRDELAGPGPLWEGQSRPDPAAPRDGGPFDVSEVEEADPAAAQRLDFGSIQVPVRNDVEVRLELDEKTNRPTAITLIHGQGAVQVCAFAAPRDGGYGLVDLPELSAHLPGGAELRLDTRPFRDEVVEEWTATGAVLVGSFGEEVTVPAPGSDELGNPLVEQVRFVGTQGPRWLLQGVFFGEGADPSRAQGLEDLFRSLVVVRGNGKVALGSPLPISCDTGADSTFVENPPDPRTRAQPPPASQSDHDAHPSQTPVISVPAGTAPALLFAAGRVAALRSWNDVEVISVADIESQTPSGAPLILVVTAAEFTADHARGLAALYGSGREVLVVTDSEPDPAAVAWLPIDSVVSDSTSTDAT